MFKLFKNLFKTKTTPNKDIKIYLIEDDNLFTYALKIILTTQLAENYLFADISTFKRGDDVITSLESETPDVIIMDLNLGIDELDGVELIQEIRNKTNDSSLVILTNLCDVVTAKSCYDEGANNYLFKGEDKLTEIVADLVAIIKRKNDA